MHQVYDDDMTFKLVAAASNVSGLPVEVCLEEFDNLHDHLASIYPGMRAPSFRVTRHLNTNQSQVLGVGGGGAGSDHHNKSGQQQQQQPDPTVNQNTGQVVESSLEQVSRRLLSAAADTRGDELHKQNASCSMAGSMYLHYYSERAGLSPIVKGLVMAVAKEFFQIDIQVTECEVSGKQASDVVTTDDHVVLKIDKRTVPAPEATATAAAATKADDKIAEGQANESTREEHDSNTEEKIIMDTERQLAMDHPSIPLTSEIDCRHHLQQQGTQTLQQAVKLPSSPSASNVVAAVNIYDSLSTNARDSLVNSEIMMQTFPFHVIFDRQFNLVQVGKSLLRATSSYWQRWAMDCATNDPTGGHRKPEQEQVPAQLVKFSDLFQIVRPKIEFTFDAIADHTNQVFVVKTRPLVLNADFRRHKRISSTDSHSTVHSNSSAGSASCPGRRTGSGETVRPSPPPPLARPMCPMDRIASMRRRSSLGNSGPAEDHPFATPSRQQQHQQPCDHPTTIVNSSMPSVLAAHDHQPPTSAGTGRPPTGSGSSAHNGSSVAGSPKQQQQERHSMQQLDELDDLAVSLRLKGQMIILLGGQLCLFLCSPRVDHLNQLMECGVRMSDFALHDRARELMLMSHTHKEDRETVKKLDQATNDLKKMDTKLRQENQRTNEVLHNIFPAKIATMLSHGVRVESESFDLVTCLYSDIIGFTKMCGSENVRPIDIVRLLNTLYLQFDNLTNIHGVFKVETIGDAYVVVGGLPEPVEDHADRCVKMGLDMVKVISTVRSPADNQPIQMRIGIHSGPVMAGIVGIRVPRYSLFGNTTTLANQLETNGVGGKIHISDFTLNNLINRNKFVIEDNPNEISSVPFVTYFVTNYIGDQTEMMNHERILEEQLIKDLELMGNEVELVDDSYHQQLVYAYGGEGGGGVTATATATTCNKQTGSNRKNQSLMQGTINAQGISGDDELMGGLVAAAASASAAGDENSSSTNRRPNNEAPTGFRGGSRSRPALGESLADDQHEQYDRLILMDIEDQDGEESRQLGQLSDQLSCSIISEALRQVPWPVSKAEAEVAGACYSAEVGRSAKLVLALILKAATTATSDDNDNDNDGCGCGGPELEIIVRHQTINASAEMQQQQAASGKVIQAGERGPSDSQCPVCEGCGSLKASSAPPPSMDLVRLRLRLDESGLDGESGDEAAPPVRALCAWLSDRLSAQQLGSKGVESQVASARRTTKSQRPEALSITTNCESLLAEVRAERYKVERLLRETEVPPQVATAAAAPSQPPPPVQSSPTTRHGRRLNSNVNSSPSGVMGQTRSLSNEIQRIKRMDTLKCQRLKKKRQQQHQQQQHQVIGGPEPDELELELELEQLELEQSKRLAPEASVPIDEEPEPIVVCDERDNRGRRQQQMDLDTTTTVRRLRLEQAEVGWRKCGDSNENSAQIIQRGEKLSSQQQQQHHHDNATAVATEEAPTATAPAGATNNQGTNYQSIRSSLASIVNGMSQRAQNRKHRFNLNPFANLSFVSPFSSPVKQQQRRGEADLTGSTLQQQQQRTITPSAPSTKTRVQAAKPAQVGAPRKQSSRSQNSSGGSNSGSGNINAAHHHHQQSPDGRHSARKSSNCSCLKSSASSQSMDSLR